MEQKLKTYSFCHKIKNVSSLALPSILALFFSFAPEVMNLHLIGLYGTKYEINGVGLGNLIMTLIPLTLMWGVNGALETVLFQAFGAKKF